MTDLERGELVAQIEANRLHAQFNPTLSDRQRKQLLKVADDMWKAVTASLPPCDVTADDELLELLKG